MESDEFIATKDQLKNIRAFVKSHLNEKDFSKDETEKIILAIGAVSYTHLTLPTNREV